MKISDIEVALIDHMGSDLSVVNAARVSFHKESFYVVSKDHINKEMTYTLEEKDAKLIRYLAKHKHTSPFNHSFITVRVKAPIFVARQLVTHKFMPWNEVSRRYVDEEPEFYIPTIRERAVNVKQGSGGFHKEGERLAGVIENHCHASMHLYDALLGKNVSPEIARVVLPQNTMTEWIWSGTLGAFADMLRLRLDPHTQYESRIVANKIKTLIEPLFPVSLPALLEVS